MNIKNRKKDERRVAPVADVEELLRVMEGHGERTLFTYYVGKATQDMTYAAFTHRVRVLAAGLAGANLGAARIAVIGETSPDWLCTYLAVLSAGGVIIPMDKELSVDEIGNFLRSAGAEAIVFSPAFRESFAPLAQAGEVRLLPMQEEGLAFCGENVLPLARLLENGEQALTAGYVPPVPDREKMSEMLFTSGTTGTSKCVMLCQRNIFSVVTSAAMTVPFYPEDVVVSVLPVHHTYELACTLAEMDYGLHICINDTLGHVMRNFQKFRPTALVLVPLFVTTMYKKIITTATKEGKLKKLQTGRKLAHALRCVGIDVRHALFGEVLQAFGGRLERIICGGAPLSRDYIYFFEDIGISVFEGFGITECAPLTAVTPYYRRKPGSVGPSVPCCTSRIAGDQVGEHGYVEGELQIKGENVMLGYYNNPEANAAAFTEDGWFRTGDVAYMDKDGYITITGRLKSVIVLENGKNVFPEEMEEYLGKLDGIEESVVVGRTQPDGTVELCAVLYLTPEDGADPQAKQSAVREQVEQLNRRLPSFKQIRQVEFRDTPFEKTTSRKIKRHLVH